VNTKHHPDARVWVAGETFMVNGQRQSYVRASRSEGRKVARLLSAAYGSSVTVTPVVAVVGAAGGFEVKEQPIGVVVCARRALARWLCSQPSVLSSEEIEGIFSVARRPSTWGTTTAADDGSTRSAQTAPRAPAGPAEDAHRPQPVGTRIFISFSPKWGFRLFGDPRPHQGVVKAAGFRWSGKQRCWYLPRGREKPPSGAVIDALVAQLRDLGLSVEVKV
jgi:hypothetical protein